MKPILFYLGLCSGYIPDALDTSHRLCVAQIQAQSRQVGDSGGYDDFDRAYFNWQVSQVVWP